MDLIIIALGFLIVVLLNLLFARLIVSKSVKKLIVPSLVDLGLEFIRVERIGFLKTGNFKDSSITIRPYNTMGRFKTSLYRYVFFKDKSKMERKTTVRIDWNLFRKTRVYFKPSIN